MSYKITWLNDQLTEATIEKTTWRGVRLWAHVKWGDYWEGGPRKGWVFESNNPLPFRASWALNSSATALRARWAKERREGKEWIRVDGRSQNLPRMPEMWVAK